MPYFVPAWAFKIIGIRTITFPRNTVMTAWYQFIPSDIRDEESIYVGMHADMEIHNAAMLPVRHLRAESGTGARSALESGESLATGRTSAVIASDMAARVRRNGAVVQRTVTLRTPLLGFCIPARGFFVRTKTQSWLPLDRNQKTNARRGKS